MKKSMKVVALGAISVWVVVSGVAIATTVQGASGTSHDLLGEGVGLGSYDPVSYFPEGGGKPVKGHIMISAQYDGVTYRFASEEHKATFEKSPAKFVPAYGGWCTWAVAELGKRVDADPESYVMKNGKLYVFYRDPVLETRAKFLVDPDGMLVKAEANWPALAK